MKSFEKITSRENPLIKQIIALQGSAKSRKEAGLFVLEGLRICSDAFENGIHFEKLVVSESAVGKFTDIIGDFSDNAEKCVTVPDALFKKISDTTAPQGIIAVAKIPEKRVEINPSGRYIGLEDLQDPSNLGAVARTAEALGVSGIVLTSDGCDPYSPKVLRASMGTLLRLPLYFADSLCDFAKEHSLRTVACVVDRDATSVKEFEFANGDIILIGNEANGLTDSTKQQSAFRLTVPMSGRAESLNAAAAAAIVMWEMVR